MRKNLTFEKFVTKKLVALQTNPFYDQVVQNCCSAGRIIAFFLNQLVEKYNFDPSKFYCAGHSLGGHVCAYTGKYSQETFGWKMRRISGRVNPSAIKLQN